jgi:hypothetical protein
MKLKKEKDYWAKKSERFSDGTKAKSRAEMLRQCAQVAHVKMNKHGSEYMVQYSVAGWYLKELENLGLQL